jgi:hypothetical protein
VTIFFPFAPPSNQAFTFQPTLDGTPFTAVVPWNLFGRRFYLQLFDLSGALVLYRALVTSVAGVAVQSATWLRGRAILTTAAPLGLRIGDTVRLTVDGMTPDAYNGTNFCLISGPSNLSFPLANDPGDATVLGAVSYDVDLVSGYFTSSTVVFRNGQFEVNP